LIKAAALIVFVTGLFALIGSSTYSDFYIEIRSKITGEFIDYTALAEFCGWTGLPFPGESDTDRGIRAFWNMLSAILGMTAVSIAAFFSMLGVIIWLVYMSGGFNESDSS